MSWAEVKKINSDFANEPLNFCNYINDISEWGVESYVMVAENSDLWHQLISQSLTMFGHESIHSYVYERFTADDVDYMINGNSRLGQSFNSFYKTDVFQTGDIDAVLSAITCASYNQLDTKFQEGINRYIEKRVTDVNVGIWLDEVFGLQVFSEYTSIQDILSSDSLWSTVILYKESLRVVICNSATAIAFVSDEDTSIFESFVQTVAASTKATMDLINQLDGNNKLTSFFADATICSSIVANTASMTAIVYNVPGFSAMIASATAMEKVANSQTAIDVIIEGITNAANTENVLGDVKTNLSSIETSLPNIANTENVIQEVGDTKEKIEDCVTNLKKVTSQSDILIKNVDALVSSETAMEAIASSEPAMQAIANSAELVQKLYDSDTAKYACAFSEVATRLLGNNVLGLNFNEAVYNMLISSDKTSTSDLYMTSTLNNVTLSGNTSDTVAKECILSYFNSNQLMLVTSIYSWDICTGDTGGINTIIFKENGAQIGNELRVGTGTYAVKKAFSQLTLNILKYAGTYPADMYFKITYRLYTK